MKRLNTDLVSMEKLRAILNDPWFGVIACGFLPGLYVLLSALRIFLKGEITIVSPRFDKLSGWHLPKTYKGKDARDMAWLYVFFGLLFLCIATTIALSMIVD